MALRFDPNLETVVAYLQAREGEIAEAFQATRGRPWMDLQELGSTGKNEAELKTIYNRDIANEDYVTERQNPDATSAEIVLSKLSGDYLAGLERDTRMRRRSRIRMLAHSAARAEGMENDAGPLRRNTVDYLSRIYMKPE